MFKLSPLSSSLLGLGMLLTSGIAASAAFQLSEVSASGLGVAYAGEAAIVDNASVIATNPALMTQFQRPEISVGGFYIKPNVNLTGKINGLNANADHNDIAPRGIIPNLYYVHPVNNKWTVGAGVNVNYGLATEFDKNYNAGFFAGKTSLKTVNFNLSAAHQLNEQWHLGLGVNAVYADALIERHLGILGQGRLPNSTVAAHLEGKEWGFGWNAGIMYKINEHSRFGLAYHSHVDITFDGKYSNQLPPLLGQSIPGNLTLNLPAYWEFSGYHRLTDALAVSYSYRYNQWSRFQELKANSNTGVELFNKQEKFTDASRIALGLHYEVNPQLTLRTGIAFDESPVPKGQHSISIPDADRTWLSLGGTYRFTPDLSLDLGYAYLMAQDNTFTETDKKTGVSATYSSKSSAHVLGLAVNYRF